MLLFIVDRTKNDFMNYRMSIINCRHMSLKSPIFMHSPYRPADSARYFSEKSMRHARATDLPRKPHDNGSSHTTHVSSPKGQHQCRLAEKLSLGGFDRGCRTLRRPGRREDEKLFFVQWSLPFSEGRARGERPNGGQGLRCIRWVGAGAC